MMQRSSISNSRSSTDDHRSAINIATEPQQNAKRRRNPDDDSLDALPLYHHRTVAGRRDGSRSRSPPADKMIHAIPMLVMLCLFTLWWFSFPDGTITTIRPFDAPISNDNTRFDLTILAVAASSPIPSISQQDISGDEEIYLPPASSPN
ncbi:unnamed protein product [Trifolium pratense]|uniref:Uncharacterized protein n=1 Tax=Trifolium pratense TaxID=57577 RepID=A0ACB0KD79_TRIPR|nr:unnamed protein product [Trifolium pratense]